MIDSQQREPLTARQQEVLDFIVWFLRENGIPPTVREISDQFEMKSINGIAPTLKRLCIKGYLDIVPKVSRGIRVLVNEKCPCCGQAVAK